MKIHYWDKLIDSKHHELVDLYGYFVFYVDFVLSSMTDNNCTRLHYMSNTVGVLLETMYAYLLPAHEFTLGFLSDPCCWSF